MAMLTQRTRRRRRRCRRRRRRGYENLVRRAHPGKKQLGSSNS